MAAGRAPVLADRAGRLHLTAARAGRRCGADVRRGHGPGSAERSGPTPGERGGTEQAGPGCNDRGSAAGSAAPGRIRHARRRSGGDLGAARRGCGGEPRRVGAHPRRIVLAASGAPAGRARDRLVRKAPGIPAPHDATGPTVSGLHRARSGATRPAHGVRAVAGRRERVPGTGVFIGGRGGPVAVHAGDRKAVRTQAELVVRRAPRRRGVHPRRAGLPHEALAGLRRRPAARGRRLQLGRGQRRAGDFPESFARQAGGRLVAEAARGDAVPRLPPARDRLHRRGPGPLRRGPGTGARSSVFSAGRSRRPDGPRRRGGSRRHHAR